MSVCCGCCQGVWLEGIRGPEEFSYRRQEGTYVRGGVEGLNDVGQQLSGTEEGDKK